MADKKNWLQLLLKLLAITSVISRSQVCTAGDRGCGRNPGHFLPMGRLRVGGQSEVQLRLVAQHQSRHIAALRCKHTLARGNQRVLERLRQVDPLLSAITATVLST